MKTLLHHYFGLLLFILTMASCNENLNNKPAVAEQKQTTSWRTTLEHQLPLLGHRNWIVLTDMAYPLQTKPGIETFFAEESYTDVLAFIKTSLDSCPHIYPHVYQDTELQSLTDQNCPGIEAIKEETAAALKGWEVKSIPHEDLIARLDSVSDTFKVLIIKTRLLKPYTSVFLELDCKYWK